MNINQFSGKRPKINPQLLQQGQATVATNIYQSSGALESLKEPLEIDTGGHDTDNTNLYSDVKTIFDPREGDRIFAEVKRSYANSPTISNNDDFYYTDDDDGGLFVNSPVDEDITDMVVSTPVRVRVNIPENNSIDLLRGSRVPELDVSIIRSGFGLDIDGDNVYYPLTQEIRVANVLTGVEDTTKRITNNNRILGLAVIGDYVYVSGLEYNIVTAYNKNTGIIDNTKQIDIGSIRNFGIAIYQNHLYVNYYDNTTLVKAFNLTTKVEDVSRGIDIGFVRPRDMTVVGNYLYILDLSHINIRVFNLTTKLEDTSMALSVSYGNGISHRNGFLYINGLVYRLTNSTLIAIQASNPKTALADTEEEHINPVDPSTYDDITNFVFTYITGRGFESQPSSATNLLYYNNNDAVSIANIPVSTDTNVTQIAIYAEFQGQYYHYKNINNTETVADSGVVTETFNFANGELGGFLVTQGYRNAPLGVKGLTSLPNGVFACYDDSSVYLSVPYQPSAYPLEFVKKIEYKIVGMAEVTQGLLVLTEGNPYLITGGTPDIMNAQLIQSNQSCLSEESIITYRGRCYYASPDGVVESQSGQIVTKDIFSKQQWDDLNPSTMKFGFYEDNLIIFYSSDLDNLTTTQKIILINTDNGTVVDVSNPNYVSTVYYSIKDDETIYTTSNDKLLSFNRGTDDMDFEWTSMQFVKNEGIIINSMRIDAEKYPVTMEYLTGNQRFAKSVLNNQPFRVGDQWRKKTYKIGVSGSGIINAIYFSNSIHNLL